MMQAIASDARIIQRLYLPIRDFLYKINADRVNVSPSSMPISVNLFSHKQHNTKPPLQGF